MVQPARCQTLEAAALWQHLAARIVAATTATYHSDFKPFSASFLGFTVTCFDCCTAQHTVGQVRDKQDGSKHPECCHEL